MVVFTGPLWRAFAVQSLLCEAGFPTLVPNANTRRADPFVPGGDAFSLSVLVPESSRTAALLELEAHGPVVARVEVSAAEAGVLRLAHAMRWLSTMIITAPFGLVLGCLYLASVRRTGVRPAQHGFNVLTILVAGLLTLVSAAMLLGVVFESN